MKPNTAARHPTAILTKPRRPVAVTSITVRDPGDMAAGLPLSTLLSQVLVAFTNTADSSFLISPACGRDAFCSDLQSTPKGGYGAARKLSLPRSRCAARRAAGRQPSGCSGSSPNPAGGTLSCRPAEHALELSAQRTHRRRSGNGIFSSLAAAHRSRSFGVRVEAAEAFPGRAEVPAIEVDGPKTWALL